MTSSTEEHPSLKSLTDWQRYQLYCERALIAREVPMAFEEFMQSIAEEKAMEAAHTEGKL